MSFAYAQFIFVYGHDNFTFFMTYNSLTYLSWELIPFHFADIARQYLVLPNTA